VTRTDFTVENVMSTPGDRAKKAGMDAAEWAANEEWKAAMAICVYQIAKEQPFLTTDPVFERKKLLFPDVDTHNRRAMGPVMSAAARAGWIELTDLPHVKTNRPSNHSRPLAVWKSLIYGRTDLPDIILPKQPAPLDPGLGFERYVE
jgi:hypothetical protein